MHEMGISKLGLLQSSRLKMRLFLSSTLNFLFSCKYLFRNLSLTRLCPQPFRSLFVHQGKTYDIAMIFFCNFFGISVPAPILNMNVLGNMQNSVNGISLRKYHLVYNMWSRRSAIERCPSSP